MNYLTHYLKGSSGFSTAESGILLSVLIAGLIGMALYLQRGMQGGMFQSSQSIGMQFDPQQPYSESASMSSSQSASEGGGGAFAQASLTDAPVGVTIGPFSGSAAWNWGLVSLYNAGVLREPSGWSTGSQDSSSQSSRQADYHVDH